MIERGRGAISFDKVIREITLPDFLTTTKSKLLIKNIMYYFVNGGGREIAQIAPLCIRHWADNTTRSGLGFFFVLLNQGRKDKNLNPAKMPLGARVYYFALLIGTRLQYRL